MAQIEIRLPKMGESVTEATITNWLKNVGDKVNMDEPLVEVATDKVDNELPSEAEGVLIKRLFEKDQVAQVGDVIAIISTDGSTVVEENSAPKTEVAPTQIIEEVKTINNGKSSSVSSNSSNKFYSPLVRSIAEKEGIQNSELDAIAGTGQDGRVTKKDILNAHVKPAPLIIPSAGDEIIEMDRMRKIIAEHMVMSKHTSPHVTSFVEADVTNIVNWRNKVKKSLKNVKAKASLSHQFLWKLLLKQLKIFQ
jgi:2-oxoglutarate dehydrogenase E2 component (dihydrolipoamide succinyltransferase)